jgi:hypothetical protein
MTVQFTPGPWPTTDDGPAREVVTECVCGQLPPRKMYAYTDTQGTAMAGTALCGGHWTDGQAVSDAAGVAWESGGWDRQGMRDCTGNDQLECRVCGWDGETEPGQRGCDECGAEPGERCRVDCTALSALEIAAEDARLDTIEANEERA